MQLNIYYYEGDVVSEASKHIDKWIAATKEET